MTRTGIFTGALLLVLAGQSWAADAGWVVRVCADQAYTWAREVEVEVTDGDGKNKQDLADWSPSSPTADFPIAGALANADALRVELDANPYDAQAYVCILYGGKLVRVVKFLDTFDAVVRRTDTDTGCPCMPKK